MEGGDIATRVIFLALLLLHRLRYLLLHLGILLCLCLITSGLGEAA